MLRRDDREHATWLVLDRPERGNALTGPMLAELADAVDDAAGPIVLAGSGDRFCTGGDLARLADIAERPDEARAFAERIVGTLDAVERHPGGVVAAVDGPALGGGCELVTAADLAVATDRARFGLPDTRIGLTAPLTVERATVLVGKKRAMQLVLTDGSVGPDVAADWGLVNDVVPVDGLEAGVAAYVERLAAGDPDAIAASKRRALAAAHGDGWRERAVDGLVERLTADGVAARLREATQG